VLAFRPGRALHDVAGLPHPLRYAAAAAVGGRILVAGGTDGTTSRDEILSVDPMRHRVRMIGRLPMRLAHAAGAALGDTFYVLGGRGDRLDSQHAGIWAVDASTGHVRRAGRLPIAGTGGSNRVNTAFDGTQAGTQRLIDTIQQNLGIKINHYVAVDFVGFQAIVNAVVDALAHVGVRHIDIPVTPWKVWNILKEKGLTSD